MNLTLAQYCPPRKGCKLVFNNKFDPLVLINLPWLHFPHLLFPKIHPTRSALPSTFPPSDFGYAASTNCSTFVEHRNFARYWEFKMLAQTLNSLPMGIVCLQETKSLCTDHVRSLKLALLPVRGCVRPPCRCWLRRSPICPPACP